jgi:hypothetical protein
MKAYGEVGVWTHIFLTSALVGGEWSASRPGRFTLGYPLDRRLGGPQSRSGRRGEEKILDPTRLEDRPLGRPARSQSLYRLRYPGSLSFPLTLLYVHITKGRCIQGRLQSIVHCREHWRKER